jgi:hypothetical protein
LCICDKAPIPERGFSVAESPLRPADAVPRGRQKLPLSIPYNGFGVVRQPPRTAQPWQSDRAGDGAPHDRCVAVAIVSSQGTPETKAIAGGCTGSALTRLCGLQRDPSCRAKQGTRERPARSRMQGRPPVVGDRLAVGDEQVPRPVRAGTRFPESTQLSTLVGALLLSFRSDTDPPRSRFGPAERK